MWLLFVLFQGLYALTSSGNVFKVPDEYEVYFQVEHLVDAGNLSVPQALAVRRPSAGSGPASDRASMFFGEIGRDGRPYAPYGPLIAILALPHHLGGRLIARLAGVPRVAPTGSGPWWFLVSGITMLSTATAGALTVAGFYVALGALQTPADYALTLSLLLGASTILWPYATSFFSEAWQAAAFIWAAALLLRARQPEAASRVLVASAAILVLIAGLTKVTSLVFAPAFVVAILADRSTMPRDRLVTAAVMSLAIATAAGIHVGWNVMRFGRPFDFGYDWSETIPSPPPHALLLGDIPRGLTVLLLSPGKSIFLWAPPLLLALVNVRHLWRVDSAVIIGVLAAGTVGLLFYAAYLFPEGGYSHGPRNLVPIIPLLLLLAGGKAWRPARKTLIAVCAIAGTSLALTATTVSYLEDQALGFDLSGTLHTTYYERIQPAQGRAWNRYRLGYIPFVATLVPGGTSGLPGMPPSQGGADFWREAAPGLGPDYFPLHLEQVRRQVPGGSAIPAWLVWGLPLVWFVVICTSGILLVRGQARDSSPVPELSF